MLKQSLLCLLMLAPLPALADEAAPEHKVEVIGLRGADFKTYRSFLDGIDTFTAKHRLAPEAPLRFVLLAAKPGASVAGVTLQIDGKERSVPVPIASDGSFALPRDAALADEDAELTLNRKKGEFRWGPDIRSPGLPPNTRRLGDLRLECEVWWSVARMSLSFLSRNALGALGACTSKHGTLRFLSPQPISGYVLVDGERRQASAANQIAADGKTFAVPLHDRKWPDDTRIEFILR